MSQQAAAIGRPAITHLVGCLYQPVYDYLCWLTGDPDVASDLTQETFIRVWRYPPEARDGRVLRAWVFKVARNVHRRHAGAAEPPPVSPEGLEDSLPDLGSEPLLDVRRAQDIGAVRRAVERLPEAYRQVIVLHNLEGMKLREVAAVLDEPLGTVKSRLATAFRILRRSLQSLEEDP